MNSFCELPRSAPKPTATTKLPIFSSVPTVPEVSMICQNQLQLKNTADSIYLSYKAWKEQNTNKVQIPPPQNDQLASINPQKKQLRFYGETLRSDPAVRDTLIRPKAMNNNKVLSFDQLYMANIPNKQLELSILDPPAGKNTDNVNSNAQTFNTPAKHYVNIEKVVNDSKISKPKQDHIRTDNDAWLCSQSDLDKLSSFRNVNDSGITTKNRAVDFYNYQHDFTDHNVTSDINKYVNTQNIVSKRDTVNKCQCKANSQNSDETVKDLLKIIQQQNEQLIILQKQVSTLINNQELLKSQQTLPAINDNFNVFNDQYKTSTQMDTNFPQRNQNFIPKKPSLQQISLDVMTSFEVSIRRPPNGNKMCNNGLHQPKICEITETECNSSNGNILDDIPKPLPKAYDSDLSFSLNEPELQVRETCPTPINSIKVDMGDYSSDDEEGETAPAWTFYNNIMAQVNHILKKSGIQPTNVTPCEVELSSSDVTKQKMMKKVKQATIKHLKNIGVHIPSTDSIDELNDHSICNPNDVSFAVKQLLMKYLPNEQLTKITHTQNDYQNVKQPRNIKRRPEFSIATVQYMQKYNLLNDKPNQVSAPPTHKYDPKPNFDRILDVTAIKRQPKLL